MAIHQLLKFLLCRKAIQRAGCNMTELDGTGSGAGAVSPGAARREAHVFTSVDWTVGSTML